MSLVKVTIGSLLLCIGFAVTPASGRVVLRDSSVINGTVLERNDSAVTVNNPYIGTIVIPKGYLLDGFRATPSPATSSAVEVPYASAVQSAEPNTNLVFVPTARTCNRGVLDFKDFELLFLTLSYAPTNSTILSGGFLFPLSTDFQLYSLAVKQQVYSTGDSRFAAALMGQISKPMFDADIAYFWNTFAIGSFQMAPNASVHASLLFSGGERTMYIFSNDYLDGKKRSERYTSVNYMAGLELIPARHTKVMVEFFDNIGVLDAFGESDGSIYFLNFAVRFFWERISVDISGLRPMAAGTNFGSLLLIPFVNVAFRFGGSQSLR